MKEKLTHPKCSCGIEMIKDDKLVWCPKCGKSFTIELIMSLYKFITELK